MRTLEVTPRGVVATLLVLAVAVVCVRLGIWQLDRLEQRRARNARLQSRLEAPAVALTRAPGDSAGWLHRRIMIAGKLDNDRSIVLPGRAFRGAPGAHVLTPVLLPDGSALLADRGWLPAADGASVDLSALPRDSLAGDTALVLPFPGQERRLGSTTDTADAARDTAFRRVWYASDERRLRAQFPYRLGAVHVRLLATDGAPALPAREPPPALDEGPHLGYAIQWFSFAIIAVTGWLIIVLKQRKSRASR
ncbi:MAG: SURF1 family protein [Gemmatimonadota bacterium]